MYEGEPQAQQESFKENFAWTAHSTEGESHLSVSNVVAYVFNNERDCTESFKETSNCMCGSPMPTHMAWSDLPAKPYIPFPNNNHGCWP